MDLSDHSINPNDVTRTGREGEEGFNVSRPTLNSSEVSLENTSDNHEHPYLTFLNGDKDQDDFVVENNPFAFSAGQLNKLLSPKSLSAFKHLGGIPDLSRSRGTTTVGEVRQEGASMRDVILRHGKSLPATNTYSCTYHGCTHCFDTPSKLQKHKREAHRSQPPSQSLVKTDIRGTSNRSFLPITINGRTDDALPDSMSSCNVISADYAHTLAAKIDSRESSRRTFRNACGKAFMSIGTTTLTIGFPGEYDKTYQQSFAVVPNCAAKLIIGNPFLQLTETLTRFKHRLRKAMTWDGWKLLYMDVPAQKLGCTVDSELAFANVDSGSDKDLVSLEYAQHREWDITPMPSDKGYVMLADGSVEKVTGYVDTFFTVRTRTVMKRFYVLDGLVCDILIGDVTIDSYDIFNMHQDSFVDIDTTFGHPDCHAITYLEQLQDRVIEMIEDPSFAIPSTPSDTFLNDLKKRGIIRQRGTDLFFPAKWRVRASDQAYGLISNGLWTVMERAAMAEASARKKLESEMAGLTGDALRLKRQASDQRAQGYLSKRQRLQELKRNLERWRCSV